MTWGGANRPGISTKIGRPTNREGADGDIQIKGTGLGAKLFAKWSSRWWDVPLSIDGITKIGTTDSDYLSIDRDSVDIYSKSVKVASFGATTTVKDINLTGKIGVTGTDNNISIGNGQTDGGDNNICIGEDAGANLTTNGDENIFIGTEAGKTMSNSAFTIGIGYQALTVYEGTFGLGGTVAVGHQAGHDLSDGVQNVFLGSFAGSKVTTGDSNICIGYSAGAALTDGVYCTVIGDVANISGVVNETVIGALATGKGNNTVTLGNNSVTKVYAAQDQGAAVWLNHINMLQRNTDPTEPTEGHAVMWMSDGTGKGGDGDVLIAAKVAGTTKYSIIFDHSAGTSW